MNFIQQVGLYWRTLKYLKLIQIYYRVWYKLVRVRPDLREAPDVSSINATFCATACRKQSLTGPYSWRFLNEYGDLETHGWQSVTQSKLWRYNQHYFDDLNAFNAPQRKDWHRGLILKWIDENPPGVGVGWEPYPTSLRIVNWIKWSLNGNKLDPVMLHSLSIQLRWLSRHLEWHLLGNHLFANAKALVFGGLFFSGRDAAKWLKKGLKILRSQLNEQILQDGAHFELSPMYHALAIEDILDLLNVTRTFSENETLFTERNLIRSLEDRIVHMIDWLNAFSHPDGNISFFNDASFGVAPDNKELFSYAERMGFSVVEQKSGLRDYAHSGYVRIANEEVVLLADFASIGPDYLPGHAHADTLSIEMSLFGQRFIVNSGTSLYGNCEERLRQRGTAAHNTITINNQNSSEVWSGFRVGSRASIVRRELIDLNHLKEIRATHDGYKTRSNEILHSRTISVTDNTIEISDQISEDAPAISRFYLHPDIEVKLHTGNSGTLGKLQGRIIHWSFEGGGWTEIKTTTWHPEFGKSIPNSCICFHLASKNCKFIIHWS